jgi:hypothetical protein
MPALGSCLPASPAARWRGIVGGGERRRKRRASARSAPPPAAARRSQTSTDSAQTAHRQSQARAESAIAWQRGHSNQQGQHIGMGATLDSALRTAPRAEAEDPSRVRANH